MANAKNNRAGVSGRAGNIAGQAGGRPVLLVVPPFHATRCPALGVSQLKGCLLAEGIRAEVLYLNLKFAERIGQLAYEWLLGTGKVLFGEFIFSYALFEKQDDAFEKYMDGILSGSDFTETLGRMFPGMALDEAVRGLINDAVAFIHDEGIGTILARNPWMVGFSSTFESNCSSLALIKEIKKVRPDIVTVLGGANCESEMGEEIKAKFPDVDYVGRGECDLTFPGLCKKVLAGKKASGVHGFLGTSDNTVSASSTPLNSEQLDELPFPDFSDYFTQLEDFQCKDEIHPGLAMETSRGCWWGIKHHCTFCAFNRLGMVFRSKSADRVLKEMSAHVQKYGVERMEMTDNILDMAYFKTLLNDLARAPKAQMFWETKANLSRDQVKLMKQANITWIQPGLESLSDKSLKLMRKGSSQLQNIQLLKSCAEYGIRVTWNWLYGFPGEDEEEVRSLANTVAAIPHLEPAGGSSVIYLERFAPYQVSPEEWGIKQVRPAAAYKHVYPFPEDSLDRLAFFFDCDFFEQKENGESYAYLKNVLGKWQQAHPESHLLAIPRRRGLVLLDTRPCRRPFITRLRGLQSRIYEYCWKARSEGDIVRKFTAEAGAGQVRSVLRAFVADFIMIENDGRYLSLATEASPAYRSYCDTFPGGHIIVAQKASERSLGRCLMALALLQIPPRQLVAAIRRRVKSYCIRHAADWATRPVNIQGPANGRTQAKGSSPDGGNGTVERLVVPEEESIPA